MRALRAAFSYFSILPVGTAAAPGALALGWLPLVGAVIGAAAGALGWAVSLVAPHAIATVVVFGASIVLTGALHVDGFLDTADALFASVPPARRLEILRDPRHGTFAVAAFTVAAALWLAALWALPAMLWPQACAWSGCLARLAAVLNARWIPYGRAGAITAAFEAKPPLVLLACGTLLSGVLGVGLGIVPAIALPVALVAALLFAGWARGRFGGGLTGDAYGFMVVALDVLLLASLGSRA